MFLKRSKCDFGNTLIQYLGHTITNTGVQMDSEKVEVVLSWQLPNTLKGHRGFIGLTGYYRRFVKNYGEIVAPLTTMLKTIVLFGQRSRRKRLKDVHGNNSCSCLAELHKVIF